MSGTRASLIPAPGGLGGILGTGDHKTLGRLYVGASLLFGLLALTAVALADLSLDKDTHILDADKAFSAFTLGQLSLVFLFLVPLFVGLATAIVPLQVGAKTIAFPRAAAAAFWTWLLSGVGLLTGYSINGAIDNGGNLDAQALSLLSLAGLVIALLLATVCIVTTVIAFRPTGMTLDRVPLFSWSMLVAGGLWVLTLPVFIGNIALVFVDVKYGNGATFGAPDRQWPQLAWIVTQPQVFVYVIPALGIVGDIVATFSRARMPQRGVFLGAIGIFGALGFGAYAQVAYNPEVHRQWLFTAQSFLIIVPVLVVLSGVAGTLRKGKPKLTGPLLLALVSLLMVALAAMLAVPFGTGRLGLQTTPTKLLEGSQAMRQASLGGPVYTWGMLVLVILAGASAAVAGIFFWAPKLTGKLLPDGVAKVLAAVLLLATVLAGVPLLVVAFAQKAEGLVDSAPGMYILAAAGATLAGLALLLVFFAFVQARAVVLGGGDTADADAWGGGQTLEWACPSPPPAGNFGELAVVSSPEPLLDLAAPEGDS